MFINPSTSSSEKSPKILGQMTNVRVPITVDANYMGISWGALPASIVNFNSIAHVEIKLRQIPNEFVLDRDTSATYLVYSYIYYIPSMFSWYDSTIALAWTDSIGWYTSNWDGSGLLTSNKFSLTSEGGYYRKSVIGFKDSINRGLVWDMNINYHYGSDI